MLDPVHALESPSAHDPLRKPTTSTAAPPSARAATAHHARAPGTLVMSGSQRHRLRQDLVARVRAQARVRDEVDAFAQQGREIGF